MGGRVDPPDAAVPAESIDPMVESAVLAVEVMAASLPHRPQRPVELEASRPNGGVADAGLWLSCQVAQQAPMRPRQDPVPSPLLRNGMGRGCTLTAPVMIPCPSSLPPFEES